MSAPPAWVVLLLVSLLSPPALAQPHPPAATPPVRMIELSTTGATLEIRVAPGRPTTVIFNAKLDPDAVAPATRVPGFQRVAVAEDTLTVLPASGLKIGERLKVPVRFADGVPPAEVLLVFVVDSENAETLVEVNRRPRETADCQQTLDAERARTKAQQAELTALRVELAALRAEAGTLTELIRTGGLASGGVRAIELSTKAWTMERGFGFQTARLYVARGLMALEVELTLEPEGAPWVPESAKLTQNGSPVIARSVRLTEEPVLQPGGRARLVVEWEAPEAHPEKPTPAYSLEVTGQGRLRTLKVPCLGRAKC